MTPADRKIQIMNRTYISTVQQLTDEIIELKIELENTPSILKYKEYEGTVEVDMDKLVCRGKILFIDDLVTYVAPAPDTIQAEFEAAVEDYIETCEAVKKNEL